jgi:hypothetical protein
VRDFYVAARDIVKAADPDNIVIAEGYSDFINQYVDSNWTFEGGDIDVARDTYARYSLPWVTRPAGIFEPDRGLVNRAFMMNAPLDVFLDFGLHPGFVRHLQRLRDLKRAVQRYLYDWDFSDGEGFTLTPPPGSTLMAKSYVGADRRIAVVVVNPDERSQSATLEMSDGVGAFSEYVLARTGVERHARSPIALQLGAYDVRVYVSEPVAP